MRHRSCQETHGFSQLPHSASRKNSLQWANVNPKECMSVTSAATQRDVARACGVHPSTISLALKNSPSIPLQTRLRVQAVAEQLGYRPNVAARNLALLRGEKQPSGSLPIAWINQESQRNHWRTDLHARGQFESARRRANELGFHLEEIWAREPGLTAPRLVQIVRARGIEGVLFPVHRAFDFTLPGAAWNEFALVGLNDHRLAEWIDLVCPDYYRNVDTILRQMRRRGHHRIGVALANQGDAASSGLAHGCFLRYQCDLAPADRLPVHFIDNDDDKTTLFLRWFQQHQPEVVLTSDAELIRSARLLGLNAVWVGLAASGAPYDGGMEDCSGEVAGAAVDWLVEKIRRFEKGGRESTRVHLIKSPWVEPQVEQVEPETVVA
jgi:LacI family transcriptional regulator